MSREDYIFNSEEEAIKFLKSEFSERRNKNPEGFNHDVWNIIRLDGDVSLVRVGTDREGYINAAMVDEDDEFILFFPKADHMPIALAHDIIDQIEPAAPIGRKVLNGRRHDESDFRDYLKNVYRNENIIMYREKDVIFYLIGSKHLFVAFHIDKEGKNDYVGFFIDRRDKKFLEKLPDLQLRSISHNYEVAPDKHYENKKKIEKNYGKYSPKSGN